MWRRAIEAMGRGAKASWYRRSEVWLILAAILVPFGWVPALCRFAWTYRAARRDRRNRAPGAASTRSQSDADHTSP